VVARYYVLYGNGDSIEGYICRLVGAGYGGDMMILARYGVDGTIEAVKMMENLETPGLGKEAEKESYMEMFIGSGSNKQVPVRKDMLSPEESDAVTGATVTFIGIGKALEDGSRFVTKMEDQ
jgi:Na+-translocating ferredoxin:NAD+ oxidoreductase subunit G